MIPEDAVMGMAVIVGLFLTGMRLGTRGSLRAMAEQRARARNEWQWKADSAAMLTRLSARQKLAQMRALAPTSEGASPQLNQQDLKLI